MNDLIRTWYGEENLRRHIERAARFWTGEGRYVISLTSGQHRAYRQDTPDDKRPALLRDALEAQPQLPGLNVPSVFTDFGTVSTAEYWGGKVRVAEDNGNPFIDPVARTLDEAMPLSPRPAHDPAMPAARSLRIYRQLCEMLRTDALWLRTPDFQGPLNTAGLIVDQQELMVAMHIEPNPVHAFLDRVTDFLIDLARYLRRESGNRICGNVWPYTFLPQDLGISFTEDLMPLLSADLYAEFGIPTLRRLQQAFGGLHIHCCGEWGRHVKNLKAAGLRIRAMEFHEPFTRLEELEPLAETTVFIPYIALDRQTRFKTSAEYYRHLVRETDREFRFWFACTEESPEMLEFVREFWPD